MVTDTGSSPPVTMSALWPSRQRRCPTPEPNDDDVVRQEIFQVRTRNVLGSGGVRVRPLDVGVVGGVLLSAAEDGAARLEPGDGDAER